MDRFTDAVIVEELSEGQRDAILELFGEQPFGLVFSGNWIIGIGQVEGAFEGGGGCGTGLAIEDADVAADFTLLQIAAVGDIQSKDFDLNVHDVIDIKVFSECREITPVTMVIEPGTDFVRGDDFDIACFKMSGHAIENIDLNGRIAGEDAVWRGAGDQDRFFTFGEVDISGGAELGLDLGVTEEHFSEHYAK